MIKPSNYLVLTTLFITLEIYRIPIPVIGYNIVIYHIFLIGASFFGAISILNNRSCLKINGEIKLVLGIVSLFTVYSFLKFLKNINIMASESKSAFLIELVGYCGFCFTHIYLSVEVF